MRIHHMNTGSMALLEPADPGLPAARAVCHTLLVETAADGLVLVEAGLGLDDVRRPGASLDPGWVQAVGPVLDPEETAVHQVRALGHDPADVRHIVLTHLDVDHAGGLPDFPGATVHVLEEELRTARSEAAGPRYRPAHRAHGPRWSAYPSDGGQDWFGLPGARELRGVEADILLIPLGGHSLGHAGVAVRDGRGWLLHAGDAFFYHRELAEEDPHGHPVLDMVQEGAQVDEKVRTATREALRGLVRDHGDRVEVVCAHDPWTLRRFTAG
ncbi:MBL fold metallo-hydrolase [Nocardiopsis sp. RSe5-2]|uniref:MBL fold metallo-hydrolase n=1 Tax=Nocardiopsis endophytica TaxID=3018445 RepID=A0ABT4TYK8_9ACTN|nr:MBL fold metallo-hydrolase [Nocardiopsis endophytica]MDA2809769.1 MBL fold metallo-hydrolase [Nocardiopsis endophytica]